MNPTSSSTSVTMTSSSAPSASTTSSSMSTSSSATPTATATSLYTDFASDSVVPPQIQTESGNETNQELAAEGESKVQPKKPNPREEWLDKENPLHCKLCDYNAEDMQSFQNHSLSIRHIKRAAEVFEIKFNVKKDEEKKKIEFHCQVCLCTCNSESAWNSHLLGQKHRKNLEKQGADKALQKAKLKMHSSIGMGGYGMTGGTGGGPMYNTQFPHNRKPYDKPMYTVMHANQSRTGPIGAKDFAEYKEPLIGLEYVTEIQVTGESPRYHCELCDAKFDHNLKFPHLVGAKHRFNVLKEKSPTVAQELRIGIKKRSELTGKLLDEALKLERQEGRQQVKTRVEASPFTAVNSPFPLMGNQYKGQARGGGFGRGNVQGRGQRGHPLKGGGNGVRHPLKGGGSGRPINWTNQSNTSMQFNSGQNFANTGQVRGRGRGGRGSTQSNRGQGRGWKGQQYQPQQQQQRQQQHYHTTNQPFPSSSSSTSYYQQQQYSTGESTFTESNQGSHMLPKEAFRPRSPPRQQESYDQPYNYNPSCDGQYYSGTGGQQSTWGSSQDSQPIFGNQHIATDHPAISSPPAPGYQPPAPGYQPPAPTQAPTASGTDSTTQVLLKGLSDLGKLVSSEEDASVALQVSNALTQALLQYRLQSLPADDNKAQDSKPPTQ